MSLDEWDRAYGEAWMAVRLAQASVDTLSAAGPNPDAVNKAYAAATVMDGTFALLEQAQILARAPKPAKRTRKTEAP